MSRPGVILALARTILLQRGHHFSPGGVLFTSTQDYLDKENQFRDKKYEGTNQNQAKDFFGISSLQ